MCYTKVNADVLGKMESSNVFKGELMKIFDMTEHGVRKMIKRNDIKLTTPIVRDAIIATFGLTEDQIYESEKSPA